MIKSNGGSGEFYNAQFKNFMGHTNAWTLDVDSAWTSMKTVEGDGVQYTNLSFSDWSGTCSNAKNRPPIRLLCPADVPCKEISIVNVDIGTEVGSEVGQVCQNAYGSGACLKAGTAYTAYTTTATATTEA